MKRSKASGSVRRDHQRPADDADRRAAVADEQGDLVGARVLLGRGPDALEEAADRLAVVPARVARVPDVVVGHQLVGLGERPGRGQRGGELGQPRVGLDRQAERLGGRRRGLLRAQERARDDARRRPAQPLDVRGEVGRLAVAELGQRVVGRPHVIGALRGLAVPRDEDDARAHAVPQKRTAASAIACAQRTRSSTGTYSSIVCPQAIERGPKATEGVPARACRSRRRTRSRGRSGAPARRPPRSRPAPSARSGRPGGSPSAGCRPSRRSSAGARRARGRPRSARRPTP